MIFRYKVEYEFDAESLFDAQIALNEGKVGEEMAITKSLEAIVSEDRIIPRKWVPKPVSNMVKDEYASGEREEPGDDQPEHIGDDPVGTSPESSYRRFIQESGQIEAEDIPF